MKPDLILDTNVVLEQVDVQDLVRAILEAGNLDSPAVQNRRNRLRHSILLGWYCHVAKLSTGVMWHEVAGLVLRQRRVDVNAPGDLPAVISSLIVYFVLESVLCDWRRGTLGDIGTPTGTDADDVLLQWAKDSTVTLITNEGNRGDGIFETERKGKLNLRGKAVREGVSVFSPGEFLASRSVDVAAEAARFVDSFVEKARAGVQLPFSEITTPAVVGAAMDRLMILYKYVLLTP